ncbi:protein C19orf12 homolog [Erythrolamprus reginae]|uniref:protein C19orf12 homolog n=1 Tax=Erythrolamprus reginae TaxID=121349 RepID=UPI00396C2F37
MYTEADWSREVKMPVNIRGVMQLLCLVSEKQKRKAEFKDARVGALVAGATAFFGGLMAGTSGFAVGGAVGSLFVAWMTYGKFKLTPQIILGQRPVVQQRLYRIVYAIIQDLSCTNVAQFKALVMANDALEEKIFGVLTCCITSKLRRKIQ